MLLDGMMHIVGIKKGKRGRLLVHTDSVGTFPLYEKEAAVWGIAEGEEFPDEKWEQLCAEVLKKRVRTRALYLLQQMDRTEAQLRRKLSETHYPEVLIDDAICYVRSYHYVDDLRYAQTYIRYHRESKSRFQLKMALVQRGVSAELIEQAINEEYADDEESDREKIDYEEILIGRLLEKKHYDSNVMDAKEKHRIYQYLLRKGFPNSKIKRCMHLT